MKCIRILAFSRQYLLLSLSINMRKGPRSSNKVRKVRHNQSKEKQRASFYFLLVAQDEYEEEERAFG